MYTKRHNSSFPGQLSYILMKKKNVYKRNDTCKGLAIFLVNEIVFLVMLMIPKLKVLL